MIQTYVEQDTDENFVDYCQRSNENYWPDPRGCKGLESMDYENQKNKQVKRINS